MKTKLFLLLLLVGISVKAQTYVPDKTRNVAVVYFVPSDATVLPNYEERVSAIMLYGQTWYQNQMHRAGYDEGGVGKTFGLVKDAALQRVQIVRVDGAQPGAYYSTSSVSRITTEVEAYFTSNPGLKTSSHVMIWWVGIPDGPYYGSGKNCFVNDDETRTAEAIATEANGTSGGVYHELAHALNVPHDQEKKSELNNPNFGMGLMGSYGIYNWKKAFFTDADCAILNVNEVFNTDAQTYYGPVNSSLKYIHGVYNTTTNAIEVSGRFRSDVAVKNILYYNDPNYNNDGTGTNHDYEAITWESKPIGVDSFFVSIPLNEFIIRYGSGASSADPFAYPYELKVKTVHANGIVTPSIYRFGFNQGVPVLPYNMPIGIKEGDKAGWTVVAGTKTKASGGTFLDESSDSDGELAVNVLDNNVNTSWYGKYQGLTAADYTFPHEVIIDTKAVQDFTGWSYIQKPNLSRAVKSCEIYGAGEDQQFTLIASYELADTAGLKFNSFNGVKNLRYFKFKALSAFDGNVRASMAELNLYTGPNEVLPVELLSFNAKAQGNTVAVSWSTASENNSDYFDVVRFVNGGEKVVVGKKKAAGSSDQKIDYQLTDFNPLPGINYYQLKQYDKDGSLATTSDIRSVNILDRPYQLSVTSATNGTVSFNVYSSKEKQAIVYLTTMLGQKIGTSHVNLEKGNNTFSLPVNGAGVYLITTDFRDDRLTRKFVVQ